MSSARPTLYRGIRMRSRLEALYAQMLDTDPPLDLVRWEYEPVCFASPAGQYLPDFRMAYSDGSTGYVEIKPSGADAAEALERMHVILASEPDADLAVLVSDGGYPTPRWSIVGCDAYGPCCGRPVRPVPELV